MNINPLQWNHHDVLKTARNPTSAIQRAEIPSLRTLKIHPFFWFFSDESLYLLDSFYQLLSMHSGNIASGIEMRWDEMRSSGDKIGFTFRSVKQPLSVTSPFLQQRFSLFQTFIAFHDRIHKLLLRRLFTNHIWK